MAGRKCYRAARSPLAVRPISRSPRGPLGLTRPGFRSVPTAHQTSAARVTPETLPQPPPPEAAVSAVEGSATQPPANPHVAGPDQTAQAPKAPQPTPSSAPEEGQATPPSTSASTSSP